MHLNYLRLFGVMILVRLIRILAKFELSGLTLLFVQIIWYRSFDSSYLEI